MTKGDKKDQDIIVDSQFKKKFLKALEENLYLKEVNKKFLISHFDTLPKKVLKRLFEEIKSQNETTEKYISLALEKDPSLVQDMQSAVKNMKKKIVGLKESEEKSDLEQTLEEELKKI